MKETGGKIDFCGHFYCVDTDDALTFRFMGRGEPGEMCRKNVVHGIFGKKRLFRKNIAYRKNYSLA